MIRIQNVRICFEATPLDKKAAQDLAQRAFAQLQSLAGDPRRTQLPAGKDLAAHIALKVHDAIGKRKERP